MEDTYTLEQAISKFGRDVIKRLVNQQAEPTSRLICPSFEPQHKDMVEYESTLSIEDGTLIAYYYQPKDADEWEFGTMNGIEYGDIECIEFEEDSV